MIEHYVLAPVSIQRIAGDSPKKIKALSEFCHSAGLKSLARIYFAGAYSLICAEDTARLLSPGSQMLRIPILRQRKVLLIVGKSVVGSRILKPLSKIDDVVIKPLGLRR